MVRLRTGQLNRTGVQRQIDVKSLGHLCYHPAASGFSAGLRGKGLPDEVLRMASGKPIQDPPGLHATRQMLDELDALMERMLALPVNDAEEATPPPTAALPPAPPPLTAKLTLLHVPTEDPPLDPPHAGTNPSHLPAMRAVPPPTALPPLLEETPRPAPRLSDHMVPPALEPAQMRRCRSCPSRPMRLPAGLSYR